MPHNRNPSLFFVCSSSANASFHIIMSFHIILSFHIHIQLPRWAQAGRRGGRRGSRRGGPAARGQRDGRGAGSAGCGRRAGSAAVPAWRLTPARSGSPGPDREGSAARPAACSRAECLWEERERTRAEEKKSENGWWISARFLDLHSMLRVVNRGNLVARAFALSFVIGSGVWKKIATTVSTQLSTTLLLPLTLRNAYEYILLPRMWISVALVKSALVRSSPVTHVPTKFSDSRPVSELSDLTLASCRSVQPSSTRRRSLGVFSDDYREEEWIDRRWEH